MVTSGFRKRSAVRTSRQRVAFASPNAKISSAVRPITYRLLNASIASLLRVRL
jgi:hypothetical protein